MLFYLLFFINNNFACFFPFSLVKTLFSLSLCLLCDFGLLFFLFCLIIFFLVFRVCVRAGSLCGQFLLFFVFFHFLQILLILSVLFVFNWQILEATKNDFSKEKLFQPKSKQALHRNQFLHLSPTTEHRNNPRKPVSARASHFHPDINTHTHTGGHTYKRTHTTPHTKKNDERNEKKTNRSEPPSRNPANCTGRRAYFTHTRSESGSTRAGPHFRPGFAHKTPVFHSNSADRTSRTRL